MNKIRTSILIIGFQEENEKMYPHLYDFLKNMRETYEDVIYIGDDDRGYGLYLIDRDIESILNILKLRFTTESIFLTVKILFYKLYVLFKNILSYIKRRNILKRKLKKVRFKYDKYFVLAIDHTATYFAEKYFHGKVVFWNIDVLAKDSPWRIKNGFLDKLITSEYALKKKVLIIQDENRKKLLEESLGINFPNTIFLPISLNDSEFCQKAVEIRQKKNSFPAVNIIQNGWIAENRWSDKLIDAYQKWTSHYKLHLHGFMGDWMENKISKVQRVPNISTFIYTNDNLLQILNEYDIGFVGYKEDESNFKYIENASSQMVNFLRLGIPIIGYGSIMFNDFINKNQIGLGISSIEYTENAIKKIIDNYSFFSYNARKIFESKYNLTNIFYNQIIKSFETVI